MNKICVTAAAVGLAFIGSSSNAAEKFTVRATIDGFVSVVPAKKSEYAASVPAVSQALVSTIESLKKYGLAGKGTANTEHAEVFQFSSIDPAWSSTFERGQPLPSREEFRKTIYLPGFSDVDISSSLPATQSSTAVLVIRSPVMEYQLLEARETLHAAVLSLRLANAKLQSETTMHADQQEEISAKRIYLKNSRDFEYQRAKPGCADDRCLGKGRAGLLKKQGFREAELSEKLESTRHDFAVSKELAAQVRISESQVQSAVRGISGIQAALSLGSISCPRRCKIVDVYVYRDQPVTKGDALFDVVFIE